MIKIREVPLSPEIAESHKQWDQEAHQRKVAQVQEERRQAYIREADPLFFGYQRGENTKEEWLDAVQAVKDSHPYPESPPQV
jgi:hypothetical protein